MKMDQAGQAESESSDTALFDYLPAAADYDQARKRFSVRTRQGLTGGLLLPALFGAAVIATRTLAWHFGAARTIGVGVIGVSALFYARQRVRRSRTRTQYQEHAALGNCRTTLTADGLTTTGSSGESGTTTSWNIYPWWFETPDLFVLTGSAEYFFVVPKRGAHSPEDLVRARALFARHLRRI
ncbi:YcxB family protein [Streptomyces sp. NPDC060184]|uniref:YcxB family protein n=1 Tax=Streptomyces sp. NPDC060184 TaxID=3347064 RepID=UPI003649F56C